MAINAITSSASIFHAYQNNRSSSAAADAERKNYAADLSSMVSISAEGKQASQAAQAAGGYTVEMYSLPAWMADYTVVVPNKLGEKATWYQDAYPKLAAASPSDQQEYFGKLQEYFSTVVKDNGLSGDLEAFHAAMVVDKTRSEQIHQQFVALLQTDPRMQALMNELGFPLTR